MLNTFYFGKHLLRCFYFMHRVPGMEAMIYCKDGQCKFVNPGELLLADHEDEVGSASQVKKLVPFILIGTTFSRTTSLPPVFFINYLFVQNLQCCQPLFISFMSNCSIYCLTVIFFRKIIIIRDGAILNKASAIRFLISVHLSLIFRLEMSLMRG